MADVKIAGLGKAFAGTPLYASLHLSIAPGETVALMGPSGVGKSTLLRIVAGIDTDFSGEVTIDGVDAAQSPAPGFMFQDARLLPWMTVAQNLRLARHDPSDGELSEQLDAVALTGTEFQFPGQLSGGMQRRVALARAVLCNPHLMLLDEPFASLDEGLRGEMLALVGKTLSDTKATALIATHRPEEAARLAHRVVVLTGRPATIVADIRLPGDPATRSRADINDLTLGLSKGGGV